MHTVALYGVTGNVGKVLFPILLRPQAEGKIKLVVLHRSATDLSTITDITAAETREVNVEEGTDIKLLADKVKDVSVLM
jgi:aspartate-semialdehyde dehydrogenase